jgi:hypothetical protein
MKINSDEQIRDLIDAGARPVSAAEITSRGRRPAARRAVTTSPARAPGRPRLVIAATAAVAAVGAATVVGVTQVGSPASAPRPRHPAGLVLTAAMVRRVAAASAAALAHSGVVRISYRSTNPLPNFGTDTITFSGQNYSFAGEVNTRLAPGRPWNRESFINRVVDGRAYDYFVAIDGLRWYHVIGSDAVSSLRIPNPRTLLRAIEPSAGLRPQGWRIIDGTRLEQLRATRLSGLGFLAALPEAQSGEHVTALDIWVDSRGVVRRMDVSLSADMEVYSLTPGRLAQLKRVMAAIRAAKDAHARRGGLATRSVNGILVQARKSGIVVGQVERMVTTLVVSFTEIGQPQHITVPPHAITVVGRG